jgi:hypothetical protein
MSIKEPKRTFAIVLGTAIALCVSWDATVAFVVGAAIGSFSVEFKS